MKKLSCILLAAAALSCTTKENSVLVVTKVVPPTVTTNPGPPVTVTCLLDPAAIELTFIRVNPAERSGTVGAIVSNRLATNANLNTILRTDTNEFQPHEAVIDYEVLTASPPAIGRQVWPVGGVSVPSGGTGSVGVAMFPNAAAVAGIADGAFVRVTFHINGKLLDGSSVNTAEREYIFQICRTAGCSSNVCL